MTDAFDLIYRLDTYSMNLKNKFLLIIVTEGSTCICFLYKEQAKTYLIYLSPMNKNME
jgi:hypothetical protein